MMEFALWLRETPISQTIRALPWLWPVAECVHFIGLALVIGVAGLFDLRLMGVLRHVPVAAVKALMPWAIVGFGLNLVTGVMFLVGTPDQYLTNIAWWAKVGCLCLAGLNAFVFETRLGERALAVPAGGDTPGAVKVVGAVSLLSWLGVLYWGRMLPFIGHAF